MQFVVSERWHWSRRKILLWLSVNCPYIPFRKMWFPVLLAVCLHLVVAEVCPGGLGPCSKGMTCCQLPSGLQGCCPLENATCCSDNVHCCPHGYRCMTGRCEQENSDELSRLTKLMVEYEEPENTVVKFRNESLAVGTKCHDGSVCPEKQTCCQVSGGRFGCCPFKSATCCSDEIHCCPNAYKCTDQGYCVKADSNMIFTIRKPVKQEAVKQEPVNTICPGGVYTCPTGDTCCPHGYGQWACCPLFAATCCDDQLHCCPHGTRCDGRGYCVKNNGE